MATNRPGNESAHLGPFQFSLRGLMVLAFGVAVGCSAMRVGKMNVGGGLLAAATTWVFLGLINEVRDLWITFHGREDLSSDVRWGWRFAAFWRMAVACLLLGYGAVNLLLAQGVITIEERQLNLLLHGQIHLRDAVFCLALLAALSGDPGFSPQRQRHSKFHIVGILAGAGAVVWCLCVWIHQTTVFFLVHVAIVGIEMSEPLWLTGEHLLDAPARSMSFLWRSLFAAGCVLVSLGLIRQLAGQWTRGLRRRLLWAGLLISSLSVVVCFPFWVYLHGLPGLSPMMAEGLAVAEPWDRWATVAPMLILLATAASFRIVQTTAEPPSPASRAGLAVDWRLNPLSYYHRRRMVASVVVIGTVVLFYSPYFDFFVFFLVFFDSPAYLPAAVLIVALQRVFSRRPGSADLQPADSPRLPLARFLAVWSAVLILLVFAVPTVASLVFAFWLSPWYRWF